MQNPNNLTLIQKENIKTLLSLNSQENEYQIIWKILIVDSYCQNIISSLFKIGELRNLNVTLHLPLKSKRESLFGIHAIYLVQPTEENLRIINEDFRNQLYQNVHIHFAGNVHKNIFDLLQYYVKNTNYENNILDIFEQNLQYQAINQDMFLSNNPFGKITQTSQIEIQKNNFQVQTIAESLISYFRQKKNFPLIYFARGLNISQEIVKHINHYFQLSNQDLDLKREFEDYKDNTSSLVLLERKQDLSSILLHPWQYGSMIHDIFNIRNGKIVLTIENKETEYDLDFLNDSFWAEHFLKPFPFVAEDIDKELSQWKQEYDKLGHRNKESDDISNSLQNALDSVPEMTEKKRIIDIHTNIASQLMKKIKERDLDKFFEVGSTLVYEPGNFIQEKENFLALLLSEKNFIEDKVRLLALYYLNVKIETNLAGQIEKKILGSSSEKKYANFLQHIRQQKGINFDVSKVQEYQAEKHTIFKSISKKMKIHGKEFLSNVQNFLPGNEKILPMTQKFDSLIEGKSVDFDCKSSNPNSQTLKKQKQKDFTVYIVGGINYQELQDLEWLAKKKNLEIKLGGCQLIRAESLINEFSFQISQLFIARISGFPSLFDLKDMYFWIYTISKYNGYGKHGCKHPMLLYILNLRYYLFNNLSMVPLYDFYKQHKSLLQYSKTKEPPHSISLIQIDFRSPLIIDFINVGLALLLRCYEKLTKQHRKKRRLFALLKIFSLRR